MTQTQNRRATRPAGPPTPRTADPDHCQCRALVLGKLQPGGRPVTIATFRHQLLVEVTRRHWRRDGCHLPDEYVDPREYVRR